MRSRSICKSPAARRRKIGILEQLFPGLNERGNSRRAFWSFRDAGGNSLPALWFAIRLRLSIAFSQSLQLLCELLDLPGQLLHPEDLLAAFREPELFLEDFDFGFESRLQRGIIHRGRRSGDGWRLDRTDVDDTVLEAFVTPLIERERSRDVASCRVDRGGAREGQACQGGTTIVLQ